MFGKNNEVLVAPSILSGDFVNMEKSIHQIESWGGDWVHCDVMDGVYVKNITFGMPMIKRIRQITQLPLDVHLMITEPEKYVEEFVGCGADMVTFHPDASKNPLETLKKIKAAGAKCGIVFNPDVNIDKYRFLFPYCDMILVMSVFAGLGGQKFIDYCLERVMIIKSYLKEDGINIPIEIDGGITEQNALEAVKAGVNVLVAGSSVFKSPDPANTIKILKKQ